jgi:hypothetical protein
MGFQNSYGAGRPWDDVEYGDVRLEREECEIEDCGRAVYADGLCKKHSDEEWYRRQKR